MRLNYNVLWIDDRHDSIEPLENSIKEFLDENGFVLNVDYHKDGSNLEKLISKPELDLILLDQNLSKKSGEELSKTIRGKEKYIEIILYTQDPNTDLREKSLGLDGIYRTHRSGIELVMKKVINRAIKKTQDLNVMRGLVIAETIDIENQVEEIMSKCFEEKGKFFREKVLERNVYDFAKKLHFLNSILGDLIKQLTIKYQKNKQSKNETNKTKLDHLDQLFKEAKKIEKEVLDNRNILAHSKVEYDKVGKACLKRRNKRTGDINFDESWCKRMRKTLIKHSQNLENLQKYI